ncbi:hypothetical protein DRQ36_05105 [bacterium]|nr:MAG: hypothetical protein DRQ36_05105 [bacterium]
MRILIVQTAFIGDCILTTPLIRRAREAFGEPDDILVVLSTPEGAQVFDNNPCIDELIIYDKRRRETGLRTFFGLARRLLERRFDIAVLPHRSFRTGLLSFMARIPRRVGFTGAPGEVFYTDKIVRPIGLPEAERMVVLLKVIGKNAEPCLTEVFPGDARRNKATDFLKNAGIAADTKFITVAPGSVWGTKRYPAEKYAEAIDIILEKGLVKAAVIIGGKDDRKLCERIVELANYRVVSAAGIGDILISAAIIEKSALFIGNDSAPGHLAAAVGTPVVCILGPTIPDFGFIPYTSKVRVIEPERELRCRPCGPHGKMKCPRGDHLCMTSIAPERVVYAAGELLGE